MNTLFARIFRRLRTLFSPHRRRLEGQLDLRMAEEAMDDVEWTSLEDLKRELGLI